MAVPTDTSPRSDSGPIDRAGTCDLPPLDRTAPFVFDRRHDFDLGATDSDVAVAAATDGRVGLMVSRPSLVHLESLDEGETFAQMTAIAPIRAANVRFSLRNDFAFVSYAEIPPTDQRVFLRRTPLVSGKTAVFEPPMTLSMPDGYSGHLIFGPEQRVAAVLSTNNMLTTISSYARLSEDSGLTFGPRVEIDPASSARLAVFERSGRLYVFSWHLRGTDAALINVRASDLNVSRFEPPVAREAPGLLGGPRGAFVYQAKNGEIAVIA